MYVLWYRGSSKFYTVVPILFLQLVIYESYVNG
jgi:hypothetical protein